MQSIYLGIGQRSIARGESRKGHNGVLKIENAVFDLS